MKLSDFDFSLPEERIALRPARPRPASRLLVSDATGITDSFSREIGRWLRPGDRLVLNDTRVIPAHLEGMRERGAARAKVALNLIRRETPARWQALARPARKLVPGDRLVFGDLAAVVAGRGDGGLIALDFDRSGADLDLALEARGSMPLPPYIAGRRPADEKDRTDYQTVFARRPGAVAAPTASLHFDEALLLALKAAGITTSFVTLHVGAGTFLPVKTEDIAAHVMHREWGEVSPQAAREIAATRAAGGRVIPVGTTALRLIESAAAAGRIAPFRGETGIFITPGYRFRITDALVTNFHLPKSTLVMLVAALIGLERQRTAYAHAIAGGYRFFSYGDASLLFP
jgi:S-adenosylmethionine:tRNA ribosyltransferase-isomerase